MIDRKEYRKAYYQANKERIKKYQDANKDRKKAYDKVYRKAYRKAKKHKPLVYLLPKENWIGVTSDLYHRIAKHKHLGRNVENYKPLKCFENRTDALELESKMHDLGFKGRHINNSYK